MRRIISSGAALSALLLSACATDIDTSALETKIEDVVVGQSSAGITTQLTVNAHWQSGYCANVEVRNTSTIARGWNVTIDLQGSTISQLWNGSYQVRGNQLTVTDVGWNSLIQPGQSVSFGFCANGSPENTSTGTSTSSSTSTEHCAAGENCALMVVDSALFSALEGEINRYAADLQAARGVKLLVDRSLAFANTTPEQLRNLLRQRHDEDRTDTVLLVGHAPYALWEHNWDGGNSGINSFYYEDLDGTWADNDGDGYHDYHGWGANPGPELMVSWLYPSSNAAAELKAFFNKSHAYYGGTLSARKRGLVVIHNDWAADMHSAQGYYGMMQGIYGSAVDSRGGYDAAGSPVVVHGDDYLNLIASGYETTVIYTHSNSYLHSMTYGDEVTVDEIVTTPQGNLVTFIGGCHSGDFMESQGASTIATAYVFRTPLGLVSTGTTWSYGPEELAVVTAGMALGKTVGQAWFEKQQMRNTPTHYLTRYGHEAAFDVNRHMYGEIFFGDPFVTVR